MMEAVSVFHIGYVPVRGRLILAPMDGYSNLPFRSICRELGSALSYTEFINALDILQSHPRIFRKFAFLPQERPVVFQIFDSDPQRLLEVALRLQEYEPDVIDINMGCSDNNVAFRGAGAGLLRSPETVATIFRTLTRALNVPVSGKIRLGWDEQTRNYLQIARIVEDNGGALLAVHARTRSQKYAGRADWDAIAEVKQSVSIPVVGNGDVCSLGDVEAMLNHTACDGVMIGRAAIGNPWIFSGLNREAVPFDRVYFVMRDHLQRMLDFYHGEYGLVLFRKHARRYLSLYSLPPDLMRCLMTTDSVPEFLESLHLVGNYL